MSWKGDMNTQAESLFPLLGEVSKTSRVKILGTGFQQEFRGQSSNRPDDGVQ